MIAAGLRKMLTEEQVLDIVPVSRSTLWRMERGGQFPRSTYISKNRCCWFLDDVIEWQRTVNERQPARKRGKARAPATTQQVTP